MYYTIYSIKNILNGNIYIGKHQTKNLDDEYMGSGKYLKRAINKHGLYNFNKKILYVFDNEHEMNSKEAELVTENFCVREDTYNLCPGGKGGWGFINKNGLNNTPGQLKNPNFAIDGNKRKKYLYENDQNWVEKYKKKLSDSSHKFRPWMIGTQHTELTKQKIGQANSEKQKGSGNSQFGTMWITNGTENKKIKKVDIIPEGWYNGRN